MSSLAILIIEAVVDFVITGGGTLTGYMVANGAVVMPSKAAILAAIVFGAIGAANQVKARIAKLPPAVVILVMAGATMLFACTSTGKVAPNLGERALNDVACGLAVAAASAGNPASISSAAQACGMTLDQVRQDLQGAKATLDQRK